LGKIPLVRSWVTHQRPSIGQRSSIPTPQGVDYLSWLGPAPVQAFHPNRFHQNWQWFWDFGNGELGAWGVPLLDVALWGMDLGLPQHVSASGGRLVSRDDGETPDTLMVEYTYPQTRLLWEHRSWSSHGLEGRSAATAFYGEKGTLIIDRGGWKIYGSSSPVVGEAEALWSPHLSNFIEGIRTRRNPSANLQIASTSTAVALLGNIAYRTGRSIDLPQQALPLSIPPDEQHLWSQQKVDPV
jgi:predicted dehydrogenase